jgi:hypothetical protein
VGGDAAQLTLQHHRAADRAPGTRGAQGGQPAASGLQQQLPMCTFSSPARSTGARDKASSWLHVHACTWLMRVLTTAAPVPLLQRMWATLAANRLNMVPALSFLIDRGLKEDAAGSPDAAATGKEVRAVGAALLLGVLPLCRGPHHSQTMSGHDSCNLPATAAACTAATIYSPLPAAGGPLLVSCGCQADHRPPSARGAAADCAARPAGGAVRRGVALLCSRHPRWEHT